MMNKNKLLEALKKDYESARNSSLHKINRMKTWEAEYNGEKYGNENDRKSQIVSRDIKKQSEWQHAPLLDPFVSSSDIVKMQPVTHEDKQSAKVNEILLNYQFTRQFDRYNFLTKALKVLDRQGTLVVQCGWDYEEEQVVEKEIDIQIDINGDEFIAGEIEVTRTRIIKNQPTAKVCRNEDIFIDPTCQDDMDKCQFVIYRYESDMSTLKSDGRYKNLNKISIDSSGVDSDQDHVSQDKTYFKFEDDPRKKLIVYEYWGNYDVNGDGIAEPIVCVWVNDVIIRLQSNPYPDKKPPFLVVPFRSIPFELYGESNAELIGYIQKINTSILRGIVDNLAQSNNGQKGIRKESLDTINKTKFLSGQNFEYNQNASINDFYQGTYNPLDSSVFNTLSLMNNEMESLTGIKSFSSGMTGNSLGSSATGVRATLDASSVRRIDIVRNIAENLVKPLIRKWMSYNSEFLEESQVVRITNEDFFDVKKDDLNGKIDIHIEVSTSESNSAKSQELSFLLQTLGPTLPQEITKILVLEYLQLVKLPHAAKKLEEFNPEPSPLESRAAELEIALKEAEVRDKQARARENEVDSKLKLAKANDLDAKAELNRAKADREDLEFIKSDSQDSDKYKLLSQELKHNQLLELKDHERETKGGMEMFKNYINTGV